MAAKKKYKIVVIARAGHGLSDDQIRERKAPEGQELDFAAAYSAASKRSEEDNRHGPPSRRPLEDFDEDRDVTGEKGWWPEELTKEEAGSWVCFGRQRYNAYKPFCLYEFLFVELDQGTGVMHVDPFTRLEPLWELIILG